MDHGRLCRLEHPEVETLVEDQYQEVELGVFGGINLLMERGMLVVGGDHVPLRWLQRCGEAFPRNVLYP